MLFSNSRSLLNNLLAKLLTKHFPEILKGYQPAMTTAGLIDQLDTITASLTRPKCELIHYRTEGRMLILTFRRKDGVTFDVDTMSMLSTNTRMLSDALATP